MAREQIHFVTGRLAEHALRTVLAEIAPQVGFEYSVEVLPITVAALMTPPWIARHLERSDHRAGIPITRIVVPGYCEGDLNVIAQATGATVERGPRDLRRLPEYFGKHPDRSDFGRYDIEILAEINHAPRLSRNDVVAQARQLAGDGADLIDLGCDPGGAWSDVADCVRALRDEGFRVSVDSFDPLEISQAVQAGAELVLSVNQSNRHAAPDWGCEVVVVPDDIPTLGGLSETIELLARAGVKYRVDPILEPIGCGFAASLGRYLQVRREYPDAEMMMGIGNLTELSDTDSAPINLVLLGYCQELGIRSVLTTQVINWARTCVRECDLARRLVYYAARHGIPPKNIDERLLLLRDPSLTEKGAYPLDQLAAQIKDHNYRLFAEAGEVHFVSAGLHLSDPDPFVVWEKVLRSASRPIDPSHAFYLGYEACKAVTALTLGKQYEQDEALNWGFLTRPEKNHRGDA